MTATPYLRVAEVADELGISTSGVYKLIQRGKLRAIRRSERGTLVPRIALDAYQRRLTHGAPVPSPPAIEDDDVATGIRRFRDATGSEPEEWVEAWRADRIEDTAENMRHLIQALGILTEQREQATLDVAAAGASAR